MSEANLNETVETPAAETASLEVDKVEAVTTEPKVNPLAGALASAMALKESNAKMFYGIVGGVGVIVVTLLALGLGGNNEILKKAESKSLAAGQKYTLKSPNAAEGGEILTVRLVSSPGAISAFDDDENKTEECRKFPVGTNVTVLDKQEMSSVVYAKVQIDEGSCSGTIGWVLGINL
ncbi:MAG: hypothetical protein PHN45_07800 [Methylococcales bacterium]|nr:hypothetical protein [Methylococcales bacterium]MDD5754636.1 hypothetical protein [Methylococcales bacterium]